MKEKSKPTPGAFGKNRQQNSHTLTERRKRLRPKAKKLPKRLIP